MTRSFETPTKHLFRDGDPDTSREAAESLNVTKMEAIVYKVINNFEEKGCISDQVRGSTPLYGRTYSTVTARYKSLWEKGLIIYTGEKRRGHSGRHQRVMIASHWAALLQEKLRLLKLRLAKL